MTEQKQAERYADMATLPLAEYIGKYRPDFKEIVETGSEVAIYLMIDTIGGFLWRMRHDMNKGRIEPTAGIMFDLAEQQKLIEYATDQTARFGVQSPVRSPETGAANPSYWRWFRWWDAYVKALPDGEFHYLDDALIHKQDVSRFRPKGDWRTEEDLG